MSTEHKPHSERWFHEYGWIGPIFPEGDDPIFAAAKDLGLEFIYGGATRDDERKWQGYPAEYESLQEQLEAAQARIAELEQSWHDSASMATYTQSASSPASRLDDD